MSSESKIWKLIERINIVEHPIILWSNQSIPGFRGGSLDPFAIPSRESNVSHGLWANPFGLRITCIPKRHLKVPQYLRNYAAIGKQAVVNSESTQYVP